MPEPGSAQFPMDDETMLDQIASALRRSGLRLPALLALQLGHPLTFLGGQLLWLAQPALSLLLPAALVQRLPVLLENPQAAQKLLARLEEVEAQG